MNSTVKCTSESLDKLVTRVDTVPQALSSRDKLLL